MKSLSRWAIFLTVTATVLSVVPSGTQTILVTLTVTDTLNQGVTIPLNETFDTNAPIQTMKAKIQADLQNIENSDELLQYIGTQITIP